MKIAIIVPFAIQKGGAENTLIDLAQDKRNLGIEWILIFLVNGPLIERIKQLGMNVYLVPSGRLRQIHRLIYAVNTISKIVRQEKVTAILSWMWKAHYYGYPVSVLTRIPAIWSLLEIEVDTLTKRLIFSLPAKGIIINCKDMESLINKFSPKHITKLVYPGVNLKRFNPELLPNKPHARRKLNLDNPGPKIACFGRLQQLKGCHVLIQAMPEILNAHPQCECFIVGARHHKEKDYKDNLLQLIFELGIKNHVTLTGFQENIPDWMQAMDVVINPTDNEAFGIAVVEAMAMAKPVIAVNNGGPRHIITDKINGRLVEYGDSKMLAKVIIEILSHPLEAHNMGQEAKKRALIFSSEKFVTSLTNSVKELVKLN